VLYLGVLRFIVRRRRPLTPTATLVWIAGVVVVGGMTFAKFGATSGLPVWLYYGVPAALTWLLPPLVLRMTRQELAWYVPLALLIAPTIHLSFSLILGWKEYMPFLPIPSLAEILG
jgi:hypothetical protein